MFEGLGMYLGRRELSTVTRLRPPGVWGLCWAQGTGRELAALRIWRWCSFGCWFSFGPSATGTGVRGCCSLAGGHGHDKKNSGRVCQVCHPAVCEVSVLSHPLLVSAELDL